MAKKIKPDSPLPWIVFYAICALCVLGASGCIFDDVESERQDCVLAFAVTAVCLVLYCLDLVRVYFWRDPEEGVTSYTTEQL